MSSDCTDLVKMQKLALLKKSNIINDKRIDSKAY